MQGISLSDSYLKTSISLIFLLFLLSTVAVCQLFLQSK